MGYCKGKSVPVNLGLYNRIKSSVKSKVKRWPSAYASGQLVRMYKQKGGKYRCSSFGSLDRWFKEKWVDVCTGKPCGRKNVGDRLYPYCRPSRRISLQTPNFNISRTEIKRRCAIKHRIKGKRLSFGNQNNFKLNSKFPYKPTASLKRIYFKNIHNEIKKMDPNMRKNDICPICLEELSEGRNRNNSKSHLISWQPCGHIMHRHCIIKLMRTRHANCPLCRADYEGFKVVKKLSSNFGKQQKYILDLTSVKSIKRLRSLILSTQPDDCLSWDPCESNLYFISKPITDIKKINFTLKRRKYQINKIPSQKFKEYIKKSKGDSVSFYSPSGTLLVIPRKKYINLMDFTFNASPIEWVNLWKKVAKEGKKIKKPFYISTHGHSVNWLHIRLEKNIRFK